MDWCVALLGTNIGMLNDSQLGSDTVSVGGFTIEKQVLGMSSFATSEQGSFFGSCCGLRSGNSLHIGSFVRL